MDIKPIVILLSFLETVFSDYSNYYDSRDFNDSMSNSVSHRELFDVYGYRRSNMDWFEQELINDPHLGWGVQNYDRRCDRDFCQARCNQKKCKTVCAGLYCDAACFAPNCIARCRGYLCRAMCIGEQCRAICGGKFCDVACRGQHCETECENQPPNCYITKHGKVLNKIETSPRTTTPSGQTHATGSGYSYTDESLDSYGGQYGGEWQSWVKKPWPKPWFPQLRQGSRSDTTSDVSEDNSISPGEEQFSASDSQDDDDDWTKK